MTDSSTSLCSNLDVVTRRASRILVILSPHAHADAMHLFQPDCVLKRPIARTFDLDQVAVRAVEGHAVVTVSPEIIGIKRVVEQALHLAHVSFRSLQDVRVGGGASQGKHIPRPTCPTRLADHR